MPDETIRRINPILDETDNAEDAGIMALAVFDSLAMLMRNASCNDDDITLSRSEAWGLGLTMEWASNSLREAFDRDRRERSMRPKSVGSSS